jgi:hypothetical protein
LCGSLKKSIDPVSKLCPGRCKACQFLYWISQFFKRINLKLELRNAVAEGVSDHRNMYVFFGYLVQIYSPFDWNFN